MIDVIVYFILMLTCIFFMMISGKKSQSLNSYFLLVNLTILLIVSSFNFESSVEELSCLIVLIFGIAFNKILEAVE